MHKLAHKGTYLFVLVAVLVLAPALHATTVPDDLVVTLDPTTFNVSPGQAFTVDGTLTQSLSDSLSGFEELLVLTHTPSDTFGFSADPALLTFLLSGPTTAHTLYSGPLTHITVDSSDTIGDTFSGDVVFIALDGSSGSTLNTGLVPFTGTIVGASTTPEPSALLLLLLGIGLVGLLGAARRRFDPLRRAGAYTAS